MDLLWKNEILVYTTRICRRTAINGMNVV